MNLPNTIIPATEVSGTNTGGYGLNTEAIAREPLGILPRICTFLSSPGSWLRTDGVFVAVAVLAGPNRARIHKIRV